MYQTLVECSRVEYAIVHVEASLHGEGCSSNSFYSTLHVLFEGDAFIAARILGVSSVHLFALTDVVRGSHITCSCVSRSVQMMGSGFELAIAAGVVLVSLRTSGN